jgi:vitamin B12 transporter
MIRSLHIVLLMLLLLLTARPAQAQEITTITAPLQLRDTFAIITGPVLILDGLSRYGYGAVFMTTDSADLQEYGLHNLDELMAQLPSVHVKGYGASGSSTPAFRGTGAGHTQLFWNQLPLNGASLGLSDFSLNSVGMADQVDVVFGLPSLAMGSGGLGGAIVMRTEPEFIFYEGLQRHMLSQEIGSFGTSRSAYQGTYGSENLQGKTRLNFNTGRNDFPFANTALAGSPEQRLENASFRQFSAMQEVFIGDYGGRRLTAGAWVYDMDRELPPTMLTVNAGERQRDRGIRTRLAYERPTSRNFAINAQAAWFREELDYRNLQASIHSVTRSDRFIAYGGWTRNGNTHYVQAPRFFFDGVDLRIMHDRVRSEGYPAGQQQTQATLATRGGLRIEDLLTLNLQLRQELYDQGLSPLLGFLGANLRWKRGTLLLNGGRNYRIPTLNDLYWQPGGNPNLLPEENWSGEAQFSWMIRHWRKPYSLFLNVGGYLNRVDNWILWVPGNAAFWSPENVQRVGVRGLEAELKLKSYRLDIMRLLLDGRLSYSFTRSTVLGTTNPNDASLGKQLIYTPVHTANAVLRLRYGRWHLRYQHEWVGPRFTTRDNSEQVAGFSLGNVHAGHFFPLKDHSRITLQAGLRNIWNASYQNIAWRPMPGRSFFVRLQWEFNKRKN